VKIISFAHLTVVSAPFDSTQPITELAAVSQHKNIPNSASKLKFMRTSAEAHDITIVDYCFRVEFISYRVKGSTNQIELPEFICSGSEIASESFSINLFKYISIFLTKKQFCKRNIQLPTGLFKNEIVLRHNDGASRFEKFLDDPGFVALAFYVDRLEGLELDANSNFLVDYERSEVFEIVLDGRIYKICIARVEGVHLEFIERVKIRDS
jgi:hypothetical protein